MLACAVSVVRRSVVGFALGLAALPGVAQAQEAAPADPSGLDAYAMALSSTPADQPAPPPNPVPPPDENAVLGEALMFDPASLTIKDPAKPLRLPNLADPYSVAIIRADQPGGSSTLTVKQPLSTEWDANVGADLGVSGDSASAQSGSSGAAWASLGLPNLASVDARVDPASEQGRLGTTFRHSIPLGHRFSVTLQDSYSVIQSYGAPADVSATALPQGAAGPSQVFDNERAVSFNVLPTGTTLAAGLSSLSNDPVTHNTLSASQKLIGPLQVTTAVTDVGQPTINKSITAGFTLNW